MTTKTLAMYASCVPLLATSLSAGAVQEQAQAREAKAAPRGR